MRVVLLVLLTACLVACARDTAGKVRTYYVAADEVNWNYMPSENGMTGMSPKGYATIFTTRNVRGLGRVYRKAIYREYTDATFTTLKPRPRRLEPCRGA
jgi:manganese oxidase